MINNVFKKKYHILIGIFTLLSIYIGFIFNENITAGPKMDFEHAFNQAKLFEKNFMYALLNYDNLEITSRISPVFISILYFFKKLFIETDLVRFALFNMIISTQLFFYKCLKLIFNTKEFNKKNLFVLSCVLYLSPSFRANAIWAESSMFGLLFFVIAIYFFLKFKIKKEIKFALLNIFFVAIASYIRPSFCLFSIYFFIEFYKLISKEHNFFNNIIYLIFFNIILALPALYYVFILDIFFFGVGGLEGKLNFNFFNKIIIISSILFFYFIPLIFYNNFNFNFNLKFDLLIMIFIFIFLYFVIINFDYNLDHSGGGLFLHLSNFLTNSNFLFFALCPLFLYYIIKIACYKNFNNFLLILIFFLITPQYHITHKYYDPLVILLCFTLIDLNIKKDFFFKKKYLFILYSLFLTLYSIHFLNYFIKF